MLHLQIVADLTSQTAAAVAIIADRLSIRSQNYCSIVMGQISVILIVIAVLDPMQL